MDAAQTDTSETNSTQADSSSPREVLHLSPLVVATHTIKEVRPKYPSLAAIKRIEGDVLVKILIDKNGKVSKAEVTEGQHMLRDSALRAVKRWQYMPFLQNGEPVEVETEVRLRFRL